MGIASWLKSLFEKKKASSEESSTGGYSHDRYPREVIGNDCRVGAIREHLLAELDRPLHRL